jgi:HNH endonuclease
MALLVEEKAEQRSVYYRAFVRDRGICLYCGLELLKSFDAFAASHLDHLKPRSKGGPDDDIFNRVIACGVCNSLKGDFDPCPDGRITAGNFNDCVSRAGRYITEKRTGTRDTSYWRDYQYWLGELPRATAK